MDLDETLEAQHLRVETATDLARVALAQGDTDLAVALVTAIVPDLETGALAGLEEPALAYLTCYRILRAAGDVHADAVLAAGHAFLDILANAGGSAIAVVEQFTAAASTTGTINIRFTTVVDNAQVNGIEVLGGTSATPTPTPASTAGAVSATPTDVELRAG